MPAGWGGIYLGRVEGGSEGGSPSHATEPVCFLRWGGRTRGCGGGEHWAGLDVPTALHLWFVLGGLHLDVDHVVARRHVALLALGHLLLRDDAVDF